MNRLEKGHGKRKTRREIDNFCNELDVDNITTGEFIKMDEMTEEDLIAYVKINSDIIRDMNNKTQIANEIIKYKKLRKLGI